jgi:hypothetical protein
MDAQSKIPYPPEFLDILALSAFEALHDYLKANDCPEQVLGLLEDCTLLNELSGELRQKPAGQEREYLVDGPDLHGLVARTTTNIAEVGGQFTGGGSMSGPRKPVSWQKPKAPIVAALPLVLN